MKLWSMSPDTRNQTGADLKSFIQKRSFPNLEAIQYMGLFILIGRILPRYYLLRLASYLFFISSASSQISTILKST